jgi:small subunit ribosomal protein S21
MHTVHVRPNENIDYALKRLKQKMDTDYVLDEVRSRRAFESTAQKRKRKERALSRKIKLKR